MRLLQAFLNFPFGGFGIPGILIISPGNITFFPAIITGRPQNLFGFILGFTGGRGSRCLIIPFKVTVSLGIILRWLIRCSAPSYVAALRWEILLTVTLSFFIFLFALERSLSMCGPLKGLPARFKKTPINSVHPNLDIAIQFTDKSINLKFIFVEIWST